MTAFFEKEVDELLAAAAGLVDNKVGARAQLDEAKDLLLQLTIDARTAPATERKQILDRIKVKQARLEDIRSRKFLDHFLDFQKSQERRSSRVEMLHRRAFVHATSSSAQYLCIQV